MALTHNVREGERGEIYERKKEEKLEERERVMDKEREERKREKERGRN